MGTSELADRLAITELINRSVAAVMRKDVAGWGSTWAEDSSWKIDMLDEPARGRDAIVAIYAAIIQKFAFVSMTAFPTELAIDGDSATGKVYSQELMFPKEGGQKILVGCFHDDYVRMGGGWLFRARRYETLYRAAVIAPPA